MRDIKKPILKTKEFLLKKATPIAMAASIALCGNAFTTQAQAYNTGYRADSLVLDYTFPSKWEEGYIDIIVDKEIYNKCGNVVDALINYNQQVLDFINSRMTLKLSLFENTSTDFSQYNLAATAVILDSKSMPYAFSIGERDYEAIAGLNTRIWGPSSYACINEKMELFTKDGEPNRNLVEIIDHEVFRHGLYTQKDYYIPDKPNEYNGVLSDYNLNTLDMSTKEMEMVMLSYGNLTEEEMQQKLELYNQISSIKNESHQDYVYYTEDNHFRKGLEAPEEDLIKDMFENSFFPTKYQSFSEWKQQNHSNVHNYVWPIATFYQKDYKEKTTPFLRGYLQEHENSIKELDIHLKDYNYVAYNSTDKQTLDLENVFSEITEGLDGDKLFSSTINADIFNQVYSQEQDDDICQ